jgi:transposase InsO family protein
MIPENLRPYFDCRTELSENSSCLFKGERLCVPLSFQRKILSACHSGHPGMTRMKQKVNDAYFIPGSSRLVEDFVSNCTACAASGKSSRAEAVPTTAFTPPSRPWEFIGIDVTGPFKTAPKTQQYIVVVSDYFSKFPEILLASETTSGRLISWLEELFARYGNPERIISDHGTNFKSHEFEDFLRAKNIHHIY